jgi:phenylpyruvate tautomerase PptA (4-oxalocrotonate tautomerase family)
MPIIDVLLVVSGEVEVPQGASQAIANAIGRALTAGPGRVWVRARALASADYAENENLLPQSELPVFVTVLHATPPEGHARAREVQAVTEAVAEALGRPVQSVHVEYAPPGRGRIAFGGKLVV